MVCAARWRSNMTVTCGGCPASARRWTPCARHSGCAPGCAARCGWHSHRTTVTKPPSTPTALPSCAGAGTGREGERSHFCRPLLFRDSGAEWRTRHPSGFFGAVLGADLGSAGGFVPGGDGCRGTALPAQPAGAAVQGIVDVAGPVAGSGAAHPGNRTGATHAAGCIPAGVSLRQVAGMRYWGRRGKVISLRRICGESSCHINGFI